MNVSVAIPAKNEADSIGDCLRSLTAQMDAGDEVIVLDNGSTDETAEIARTFDGVRVLDAPDSRFENGDRHVRGLANLRQLAAKKARNEIVASTDADSVPPRGWLDTIKQHFRSDPDLSVLWGVVDDENGVPVRNLTGKYLTFLGGVSGANTAFRKSDFEDLRKGYKGWPMFEDVALISRLSRTGKAKHDTSLRIQSDLDRTRYQTYPLVGSGAASIAAGALAGGPLGAAAAGTGVGLAGTELTYEPLNALRNGLREELDVPSQSLIHHDQIGLGLVTAGAVLGGQTGAAAGGLGAGILAHHVLTEGVSAAPSEKLKHTHEVCRIDDQGEVVCEPRSDTSEQLSRVLTGLAAGAVAARVVTSVTERLD